MNMLRGAGRLTSARGRQAAKRNGAPHTRPPLRLRDSASLGPLRCATLSPRLCSLAPPALRARVFRAGFGHLPPFVLLRCTTGAKWQMGTGETTAKTKEDTVIVNIGAISAEERKSRHSKQNTIDLINPCAVVDIKRHARHGCYIRE